MKNDVNEKNIQLYTNVFVLIATKFNQTEYLKLDTGCENKLIEKEHTILNHLQYRAHVVTYNRILELINVHLSLPTIILRKLLHEIRIVAINEETPQNIVCATIEIVINCLKDEDETQNQNTFPTSKRLKKNSDTYGIG